VRSSLALAVVALVACSSAAPVPPRAPRAPPAPYRYGYVAAAFRCQPDWGEGAGRVLLVLSSVFGHCPTAAPDPLAMVLERARDRARLECEGEADLLFDAVLDRPSRREAEEARAGEAAEARVLGRGVLDLDFTAALPIGTCE
jgi:hypothetical protein